MPSCACSWHKLNSGDIATSISQAQTLFFYPQLFSHVQETGYIFFALFPRLIISNCDCLKVLRCNFLRFFICSLATGWYSNCHYGTLGAYARDIKTMKSCYELCKSQSKKTATLHTTSFLCYCSDDTTKSVTAGLECMEVS